MCFHLLIIGLLLCGTVTGARAQADTLREQSVSVREKIPALPIVRILVTGNRHTKTPIILREMKTQVGDTLDIETLQADQKRILNLGLFNRVEIDSLQRPEGLHILVGVTERLYFLPFPIFFITDRDWSKISFGAGVVHTNFRGRSEILAVSGWAGYNPALQVDYSNPWLFGPAQLLTSLRFFAQRVASRSLESSMKDVNEKYLGGYWSIGRRFNLFTYLSLSFGYTELKYDPPVSGKTLDPSGHDRLPSLGVVFTFDKRDLFEYPRSGVLVKLWARRNGFTSNYIHYLRYGADLRGYQKIYRGLSLGGRVMTDLSHDPIPLYDRVFLGYANRVRGNFYQRREGENLAMASVELRFPILPWRYFSLSDVPMFAAYMQNMKFGISAGIFADYGQTWFQGRHPDFSNGLRGFGAGLHIHLPYIYLLRLELGFDEHGHVERIADIGVAF
ncbi:MAG: BamA/TamA family outer membrane protein [candidate division KSB1 bacterium]|nr:BamA/TamA family outer membrane protein [candidate division KSB1 bacterium]MDZ7300968.1 BamA/TamA family outer membrane protein [candidate division KSB1 bacterium]